MTSSLNDADDNGGGGENGGRGAANVFFDRGRAIGNACPTTKLAANGSPGDEESRADEFEANPPAKLTESANLDFWGSWMLRRSAMKISTVTSNSLLDLDVGSCPRES